MKLALTVIGVGLGLAALPASASSSFFVPTSCTPPSGSDCPGSLPGLGGFLPARVQQIIDGTLFTAAGINGPIVITGIALRPGTDNTATGADLGLTLLAGTTSVDPDTGCAFPSSTGCTYGTTFLSTAGFTTVLSGAVSFATSNAGTPKPFDFLMNFGTSFTYDPSIASNNLIFDLTVNTITNVTGPGTPLLTLQTIGQTNRQPGTGGVLSFAGTAGQPASGLVLDIFYTTASATPEPATFVLLGGGLAGMLLLGKRARRS